jgi:hypothetical protein
VEGEILECPPSYCTEVVAKVPFFVKVAAIAARVEKPVES